MCENKTFDDSITAQVEDDVRRMLNHIVLKSDLRDFSDDIDSILAACGSMRTTGDFVGADVAYWAIDSF